MFLVISSSYRKNGVFALCDDYVTGPLGCQSSLDLSDQVIYTSFRLAIDGMKLEDFASEKVETNRLTNSLL
jgi:hypothetical protein